MKKINITISDEAHAKLIQFQKQSGDSNLDNAVDSILLSMPLKKTTETKKVVSVS